MLRAMASVNQFWFATIEKVYLRACKPVTGGESVTLGKLQ